MTTATLKAIEELAEYRQWVTWRYQERDGKTTKIPFRADGKGMASTTNPETWSTYAEAMKAYENDEFDGVGFVFTTNDPFTGIDLDKCRNKETGEIESRATDIINRLDSYTEITPSGTGLHILIKANLPQVGNRKGKIEFYDKERYFTFTGNHLEGTPYTIEDRQNELDQIHSEIFEKRENKPQPAQPVNLDDKELLEKAFTASNRAAFQALWNGDTSAHSGDDSAADMALCCHLAFWTGNEPERIDRLFRQSGLYREKWERQDYRERTIQRAIKNTPETYSQRESLQPPCVSKDYLFNYSRELSGTDTKRNISRNKNVTNTVQTVQKRDKPLATQIREYVETSAGYISYDEIDRELDIQADEREARRQAIYRLLKEKVIEKHRTQNKLFRYINPEAPIINFKKHVPRKALNIRFPVGIHHLVKVYPKNIIVLAGAADAGKTSFVLNTIKLNHHNFDIHYFNSEMGEDEFTIRLQNFEGMEIDGWNFNAYSRSDKFHDVIVPSAFNIVDFMEIFDNFYEIGERIAAIHDKLTTGICIVCVQMNHGADTGRGGSFGLEKPRLYLTLDEGVMTIRKAKNWRNPVLNPNRLKLNYKIVGGGSKFVIDTFWHKEGEAPIPEFKENVNDDYIEV